jgi:four helix bundle protein
MQLIKRQMNNQEFGKHMEIRTKKFAINIVRLSSGLKYSKENDVIKNQITKSGTSVGANYREANRARSKADFINKIKICESEINETIFWLELINELNISSANEVHLMMRESNELLAIFTSIAIKLKCP